MTDRAKPPSAHEVPQRVIDRIWNRVDVRGPDECWPWLLSVGSHGYGQVGWSAGGINVMTTAHRVVYIAAFGPIMPGFTIDHDKDLCPGGPCCNPAHMREVSNPENAGDPNRRKTHCPRGHAYDEANTYVNPSGHRACRACARERKKN